MEENKRIQDVSDLAGAINVKLGDHTKKVTSKAEEDTAAGATGRKASNSVFPASKNSRRK